MYIISLSSESRVLQSIQCTVLKLLQVCFLQGYPLKKRKMFRMNQSQEEFYEILFTFITFLCLQ